MLADRVRMGSVRYKSGDVIDLIGFEDILEGKIRMESITGIDGASSTTVPSIPSDFSPLYYDGWHIFYDYDGVKNELSPHITMQYDEAYEEEGVTEYRRKVHTFIKYDNTGNEIVKRIFAYSPLDRNYYIAIGNLWLRKVVKVRGEFILRAGDEAGDIVYRQYYDVSVGEDETCYLTTCMVNYYGEEDNGIELNSMRKLRSSSGYKYQDVLDEYYKVSPYIIKGIEQSDNKDYYYSMIKDTVNNIVAWVKNEEWNKAEIAYLSLYNKLKEKFGGDVVG